MFFRQVDVDCDLFGLCRSCRRTQLQRSWNDFDGDGEAINRALIQLRIQNLRQNHCCERNSPLKQKKNNALLKDYNKAEEHHQYAEKTL